MTIRRDVAKQLAESTDATVADMAKHYLTITQVIEDSVRVVAGFRAKVPASAIEPYTKSAHQISAKHGLHPDASFAIIMNGLACPLGLMNMLHMMECQPCLHSVALLVVAGPVVP